MKKVLSVLLCVPMCFIAFSQVAEDDDIIVGFNSSGNLAIGKSIDINNPNASKQDVIESPTEEWLDGGSPSTALKASLVTSSNELYEKLNLNVNLQGEVKLPVIGGGRSEFDMKTEIENDYSDNNLYYVIHAYNDFGRQGLKNPKLKGPFQRLIDENKYEDFIRAAGTHFVIRQRRASTIYALITISKLNSITKRALSLNYNNSLNINIQKLADLSGKQTYEYKNLIKTAYKFGSVKLEFYLSGTEGLSKLASGFPQSPDDLPSLVKALSNAASSVLRENSTPIEYHLASFAMFDLRVPVFEKEKVECLSKITNRKLVIRSYLNKARKIVLDQPRSDFTNYYQNKIATLTNAMKEINRFENDCKVKGNCCENLKNIEPIIWLEDIVTINSKYVVADYVPIYKNDGSKVGKIIKSLKLVVEGQILNNEYYCCIDGFYLDSNLDPVKTNLKMADNSNPALSETEIVGAFQQRQYVYIIDIINIDYMSSTSLGVLYDNGNLDKSLMTIDKLRRNDYFVEVTSKDQLKNYVYLGAFDFNNIKTLILE